MAKIHLLFVIVFSLGLFVPELNGQESKLPYQDNMLSALFSPAVLKDLELVDDQRKEIDSILKEIKGFRNVVIAELKAYSKSGATPSQIEKERQAVQKQIEERKLECLSKVTETLLPHQMDRLRQSTVQ